MILTDSFDITNSLIFQSNKLLNLKQLSSFFLILTNFLCRLFVPYGYIRTQSIVFFNLIHGDIMILFVIPDSCDKGKIRSNENILCSIVGETNYTYIEGLVELFLAKMYKVALFFGPIWFLVIIIYAYVKDWSDKNPISMVNRINLGYCDDEHEWPIEYYYSNGSLKYSWWKPFYRGLLVFLPIYFISGFFNWNSGIPFSKGFLFLKIFLNEYFVLLI